MTGRGGIYEYDGRKYYGDGKEVESTIDFNSGKPHFTHTQEPHKVSEPVPGEYEALNIVRTSSAAVRDMLVKLGIDPKHENAIFEFGVEMYKQGIAEALRQAQKIINQLGGKDGTPQS